MTDLRRGPHCRPCAVAAAYRMRTQPRRFLRTDDAALATSDAPPRMAWCDAAPHCRGRHAAVIPQGSPGAISFGEERVRSAPVAAVRTSWGDAAATSRSTRGRRPWASGSSDADRSVGTSWPTALTGSLHAAPPRSIWTSIPCHGPTLTGIRPSWSDVPRVPRSSAAPCPNARAARHSHRS